MGLTPTFLREQLAKDPRGKSCRDPMCLETSSCFVLQDKSVWSLDMLNAGFSTEASFSWMLRRSPNWLSRKYLLIPLHPKL